MAGEHVTLAHGIGGRLTHELIRSVFVRHLANPLLNAQDDSAVGSINEEQGCQLAMTTDSYVVQPLFFPGGDIGTLAVAGTVNDLAMVGARPRYLTAGFILEEGLAFADLERVVASMARTAKEAGVEIVAGDTKVVEKGSADLLFINTTGVGIVPPGLQISGANARPGDIVLLSGAIGMHGLAILSQRDGLRFGFPLPSDCAPLNGLVEAMLQSSRDIHCLRDPTRGGLATTLNELAQQSGVGIEVDEEHVPVPESVQAACELLGIDPLYVANEGKLVAIVPPDAASSVLAAMRNHPYGREATVIGHVTEGRSEVVLRTRMGTARLLGMLSGAQLPRIC